MALWIRDYTDNDDVYVQVPDEYISLWIYMYQTSTYLYVVLLTILIYYHLCTLKKEIQYFWGGKFGTTKLFFFLNRYVGLLAPIFAIVGFSFNATLLKCNMSNWIPMLSYSVVIISMDYILMLRVLALYQNSKLMMIVLATFFIIQAAGRLVLVIYSAIIEKQYLALLGDVTIFCTFETFPTSPIIYGQWILPLAYGLLLLCLALYKANEFWRLAGFHGSQLIYVLVSDQAIYFVVSILCSILNVIESQLDTLSSQEAAMLVALGSPTLLCMLGSHMFFNVKEAAENGVNVGTNWASHSLRLEAMDFAMPDDNGGEKSPSGSLNSSDLPLSV